MTPTAKTTPPIPQTPLDALKNSVYTPDFSCPAPRPDADAPSGKPRKQAGKTGRSRAREFVVQALYQHLVGGNDAAAIDAFTRALTGFHKGDSAHFDAVFHGCVEHAAALDALIAPHLDRDWADISPIEHVCMWIGAYEMQHCPDVPWRVVLNECVELAKSFGGTDGYKYVNGILNTLAAQLRAIEVQHDRQSTPNRSSPARTTRPARASRAPRTASGLTSPAPHTPPRQS